MATCTSCGFDVTGKKFCPECGTPVQAVVAPTVEAASSVCPRCNGAVKAGASFCMHCGSALTAQTSVATAPSQTALPQTRQCIACHAEVPATTAFCTNCGQPMQATATAPAPTASAPAFCNNCGRQNAPGVRFCGGCGNPLGTGTPAPATQGYAQTGPYGQPSQSYASQYDQSQYGTQSQYGQPQYGQPGYQQPGTAYPQQGPYPQQYGQAGYQQQPMVGQQPMVLRCPVCMAMAPVGTTNCAGCRTSLAGVVPTPAAMPMQGQQGGGLGGMFQGQGGNMAMGALGGAAAVIGGEILLHDLERGHERRYDDDGNLLGGLGGLANDIGLF